MSQPAATTTSRIPAAALAPMAAGPLLLEAVRRAVRQSRPTVALVVRLARLVPAPRPHHRRIARAIIDDAANRDEGQVFALGGGDLVLMCRQDAPACTELATTLPRLLGVDAGGTEPLVSCWTLPGEAADLLSYAEARAAEAPAAPPTPPERVPSGSRIERVAKAAGSDRVADLLHRQTGIVLGGATNRDGSEMTRQIRPLYREVSFSIAALEGRAGPGDPVRADPYLFQHLAGRLDQHLVQALMHVVGAQAGPSALDPARAGAPRLHLNLTLDTAHSASFAAILERIEEVNGICPAVEVALIEAMAQPALLGEVARHLEARGSGLVIDGVAAAALLLAELSPLPAMLLKVDWAAHLPRLGPDQAAALQAAITRIGPSRVVLHRADSEAAISWGLARGIRRFQGRHVDAMLAAARLAACRHADGCTLRQCAERHTALGTAPRQFCHDHALLDAGAPEAPPARPPGARPPVPKLRAAA